MALEIIEADRPFETVGEEAEYNARQKINKILINEIADACIKGEPTARLTRIYNQFNPIT